MQDLFNSFFEKTLNPRPLGDSDAHLMTMFSIGLQIKAKKILELGIRYGDSTEPLLAVAVVNQGHLTSVDIAQDVPFKCPEDYKVNFTFIQSDAILFLENEVQNNKHYDLIYVDDWHAYEHVKRELELIDSLTDKKSIILLHDLVAFTEPEYHWPVESPVGTEWSQGGPTRAVFELDKLRWEFCTIPFCNGLTILRKKV